MDLKGFWYYFFEYISFHNTLDSNTFFYLEIDCHLLFAYPNNYP